MQATIAARIDRLPPEAKRTLNAAAVIGSRFGLDLLTELGVEPVVADLVAAQFIDQVKFTRQPEFVFHHPLIRAVAYEAQLKSDRADLHRRVAAAIEQRGHDSVGENAALIAEHLEAAGDLRAAYAWHMRAAAWSGHRDITAARGSWERARQIADALPDDDPDRLSMRIAARALLCAHAYRVHVDISGGLFEELRELCAVAGDKRSLAIGMAGLVEVHMRYGRVLEASLLASETMALVESIGDPTLTIRLSMFSIAVKLHTGQIAEALRWSQTVIDLADGEPAKAVNGNSVIDWPLMVALAHALATRGTARCALGDSGWRSDLDQALAKARSIGPLPRAGVTSYYGQAIASGVLVADDAALRDIEDALRIAERSSEDLTLGFARCTLGGALVHRESPAERERGLAVLGQVRDMCLRGRFYLFVLPGVETLLAREQARRGDRDGAIPLLREAVDDSFHAGQLWSCIGATAFLVETLLERGARDDAPEAEAAIERLATAPADDGLVGREIWLVRLRALLARAHGDEAAYTRLSGSLPRHGDIAGLRGTHEVGRGDAMKAAAPSGVVTFLFTDVEGSTRRWEADADAHAGGTRRRTTMCCAPRSRRTAAGCSSTPATACAPRSPRRGPPSMRRWPRSGSWSCRCGWGLATGEAELRDGRLLRNGAQPCGAGDGRRARRSDPAGRLDGGSAQRS